MEVRELKVAIVHDFLVQIGGAEKVLQAITELYPYAPIYTLLYDAEKMKGAFQGKDIRPSYLQKLPKFLRKRYQWLLPFFLVVPETFDLRNYDLVISSSGAWTKGIVTKLHTCHVSYLHSPMRFVWDYNSKYFKDRRRKVGLFAKLVLSYLRIWDRSAADRPDYIIANSKYTKQRIAKYYRRESKLIYPPVSIEKAADEKAKLPFDGKFFMLVSRLSGYKKIDVVVEAFNKLELPLVIVGEGEQGKRLRRMAKANIKIVGWKDESVLAKYYANTRAFIFAADDDFGISPVEAMHFGIPVIAFKSGGIMETVIEGVNGVFFEAQTPEVLADGVRRFIENEKQFNKAEIIKSVQQFNKAIFKKELLLFINEVLEKNEFRRK